MPNNLELLSPAGSLDKLKFAFEYGADAVYIGAHEFSLRKAAENVNFEELREGVRIAHSINKRVYAATNIVAKNNMMRTFPDFLKKLGECEVDAVIVADIGVFSAVRELAPKLEVHISTQANAINYESCTFFHKLGAKRIVLARELLIEDIREIREKTPKSLELEAFVHGAMCISYSGRCLMSDYMTGRPSNSGECAQSCRWKYSLMEEKRPNEYFPVYENDEGTYLYNSKDLCLIEHIKELHEAGISSLKIEGRVKTEFYVATITNAYAGAVRDYKNGKPFNEKWLQECLKVSHRDYFTGFLLGEGKGQIYSHNSYIRNCELTGIITDYDTENKRVYFKLKNSINIGDKLEILQPSTDYIELNANKIYDEYGVSVQRANRPMSVYSVPCPVSVIKHGIIRKGV